MNQETANYIVTYYTFLYNDIEKQAIEQEIIMMSLTTPEDVENCRITLILLDQFASDIDFHVKWVQIGIQQHGKLPNGNGSFRIKC